MDKWVCKVCGYIYEGAEPPAECPVCKAPASMFEKVEGELKLAAEHEYGVYAKTVKDNSDVSARATPRSASTGRRPPTRRPSTPPSSPSCWARSSSPT